MAYTRNDGVVHAPRPTGTTGRVTGGLLLAVALLVAVASAVPVASSSGGGRGFRWYLWGVAQQGSYGTHYKVQIPFFAFVLVIIVVALGGVLLAAGVGARRAGARWFGMFGAGLGTAVIAYEVLTVAAPGTTMSSGPGFWLLVLALLLSFAASANGSRELGAAGAMLGGGTVPAGGRGADGAAGAFLLLSAAIAIGASFLNQVSYHGVSATVWHIEGSQVTRLFGIGLAVSAVLAVTAAVALFAGFGSRNPRVRPAGGAAAGMMLGSTLILVLGVVSSVNLSHLDRLGPGAWVMLVAFLFSIPATIASLVASISTARPAFGASPVYPAPYSPNPFAPPAQPMPGPNPFAPAPPAPNPFAPAPTSQVEATVKIQPEAAAPQPPRMAKVYDGRDAEGRPVVDRPALEGNTRTAVLAYLESAPIVLAARSFEQDEFAPADRDVPLNFRTDGTWVWAGAVAHYLHKHGLPPEAELVRHIADRGFQVGEVGKAAQDAAIRVITGS